MKGTETVEILNLDSALLRRSRKSVIEYFEELDETDFEEELQRHLDMTRYPIGEFYSAIEYLSSHNLLLPN